MTKPFDRYQDLHYTLPQETLAWNMYAAGTENIGKDGKPETFPIPEPNDDQLLVRVDAVGLCFSDVKLLKLGSKHAKLYNRDLAKEPTRVGHEASFTVIKVGKNLQGKYQRGQRLAIQPDIYQNQRSTAYGYTIPGGLIQYHLIGPEVLDADDGAYVLPVEEGIGYAEAALTEPWACVDAAYTQRRRLTPKAGGTMWIVGNPGDTSEYTFSKGLDAPAKILISNISEDLKSLVEEKKDKDAEIVAADDISPQDFAQFSEKNTGGNGFDDIILLAPTSAELVSQAVKLIGFRGTLNIVGREALDGTVAVDAGRLHYHYTAFVGTRSPDISAAYGEERNRCDLKTGGAAIFIGAGGPMGQMHVQRAVEDKDGPALIIATEINAHRLEVLESIIAPLAKAKNKRFFAFNPETSTTALADFMKEINNGELADDAVVCVPVAPLMESAAKLLNQDGMLVFFAGVPVGTMIQVDLSPLFLNNLQLTGTSGSSLDDQNMIMQKTLGGKLNPNRSVAAIGGMEAAVDGLNAMMSSKYAGKILIFPQINNLPLIGLDKLREKYPQIAEALGENNLWTAEAEKAMINAFWKGADNEQK
jgi:threonine dehydrogenase-like Zn-dependent dehydrogenase